MDVRKNVIESIRIAALAAAIFSFSIEALRAEGSIETPKRPRVALALEGGGALGLAHIGVIKVLEEEGVPIDIVVGTSMGSIVGGLYAMGYDAEQMESIARSADWEGLFSEKRPTKSEPYDERVARSRYVALLDFDKHGIKLSDGLLTGRKILELMDSLSLVLPSPINFDALPRPYRAVATDLDTGEPVVLDRGSIADAMRASMSIPGAFSPYSLDGRRLVDGGLVQNLPVETAKKLGADIVIAVDLRNESGARASNLSSSPIKSLSRSLDILIGQNVERSLALADFVITVDTQKYKLTDFGSAGAILDLGEAAARRAEGTFEAIRERIGSGLRAEAKIPTPRMPKIAKVVVQGGKSENRSRVEALFEPLVGTVPDQARLKKIFDELEESKSFEYLRTSFAAQEPEPTLVVRISEKPSQGNEFGVSFSYESTYSTKSLTSKRTLSSDALFADIGTPGSSLAVQAEILDAPGLKALYSQPLAPEIMACGYAQFERDFATYLTASSLGYRYQTITTEGGLSLGYEPIPGHELSLGWSYSWIHEVDLPDSYAAASIGHASLLRLGFSVRNLDSPIFPMDGISNDLRYTLSLRELGSQRAFSTLVWEGSACLSLDSPISMAFLWKAGTDFSKHAEDTISAPYYYKPSLEDRRLFPGPISTDNRIGSHAAAAGIEAELNLKRISRSLTAPVFVIGLVSAGTALRDFSDIADIADLSDLELWNWTTAIGLGLRINDGFGISLKGGVAGAAADGVQPFISLDLGALGYR
jgi:NTE family protein